MFLLGTTSAPLGRKLNAQVEAIFLLGATSAPVARKFRLQKYNSAILPENYGKVQFFGPRPSPPKLVFVEQVIVKQVLWLNYQRI